MNDLIQYHEAAGLFIARVFLGLLFFFQGKDAVFGMGVKSVYDTIRGPLTSKGVPAVFIRSGAFFTSYVQLFCGAMLMIGLFKYIALYFLGLDLLIAAIGLGIAAPLVDTKHLFPRAALLILLLLTSSLPDIFSLDNLLFKQ